MAKVFPQTKGRLKTCGTRTTGSHSVSGRDIRIHVADPLCYTAETNTALQRDYISI